MADEKQAVAVYVVYDCPADYPHDIVVRRQDVVAGVGIVPYDKPLYVGKSIRAARQLLRERGLYRLERSPDDAPAIVETWI